MKLILAMRGITTAAAPSVRLGLGHFWLFKLVHGDAVVIKLAPVSATIESLQSYAAQELRRLLSARNTDYAWEDLAPKSSIWIVNPMHPHLPALQDIPDGGEANVAMADCKSDEHLQRLGYCLAWWVEEAVDGNQSSSVTALLQQLRADFASESTESYDDECSEEDEEHSETDSLGGFIVPDGEVDEELDDSQSEHSEYHPEPPRYQTRGVKRRYGRV